MKKDSTGKNKKLKIRYPIIIILLIILILLLLSVILNEELLQIKEQNIVQNNIVENNSVENNLVNIVDNNISGDNTVNNNTNNVVKPNGNTMANNTKVDTDTIIEVNSDSNQYNEGKENDDIKEIDDQIAGGYTIISENKTWAEVEDIQVFKNEYYVDQVIAPGVEGQYKFQINNGLVVPMNYLMQFMEYNNKNINMKYKLKLGDEYIIDKWTNIREISLPVFKISSLVKAKYTLEWKWEDSPNDTSIGLSAADAIYNLKILITSTQ